MLFALRTHPVSAMLPFLFLVAELQSAGQVASLAARDASSTSEVLFDVTVLGFPRSALSSHGIVLPEPGRGGPGFAVPLQDGQEKVLATDPSSIVIHNLTLRTTSGNLARVRVDTRVPAPNISAETYFEVSIGLEVAPRVVLGRHIAMTAASVVQVRRGSGPAGSVPSVLFETAQVKHEVQVPDGKAILLGGFISAADSPRLPNVPMIPGNPILNYVYSKASGRGGDSEIVVLLTPRLTGGANAVATSPPPSIQTAPANATSSPAVPPKLVMVKPPAPPAEPPLVMPAAANPMLSPTVPPAPAVAPPPVPKAELPAGGSAPANPSRQLILPAPVRPAGTSTPASSRAFYSVQVGAFDSSANADALIGELKSKFEGAYVDTAPTGRTPFRVRIGRLSDIVAARQLQGRLEDLGFDSFVVFTNSP
jgi:cell division septation protein DedD